ncbi:hypothetical protein MUK42_34203 [Musa troglodytarum]|uniref:GBF-interacting protein 1 N-terminal domain-containing protein n=1 Tax=Musa troglodytarum TaxID=320322 RepID=A0A9E7GS36_9LILI|nr:hypothetical protein MUK42_34203 [Musa troglodytarum]
MSGAGGGGNRGSGAAPIPTGSRKLVQSLKEIVNCPEAEIYAMLRECNMDPNEAVHRLLSQDTFHEVKSKRDKKKEIREPPESRSRTVNGRGARGGLDRGGRSTSSQSNSTDYGAGRSKSLHKKENGASGVPNLSVVESSVLSSSPTQRPTTLSKSTPMGNTIQATTFADGISMPMQPSSGFQNSWLGKPGHVSMADIVKMGRPQGKPIGMPSGASEGSDMAQIAVMLNMPHHNGKQSPTTVPLESDKRSDSFQESIHVSEISHDFGISEDQCNSDDGWSLINKQPMNSVPTTPEVSVACAAYENPLESASSNLVVDGTNLDIDPHLEEIQDLDESHNVKNPPSESRSTSVSDQRIQVDTSKDASHLMEDLLKSTNSYQSQLLELDHHEGSFPAEDVLEVSSATADLRQLSFYEETSTKSIEASSAVIIPNHLRVTNADCAHLSFGSFGSGAFSGSFPSKQLTSNLEVPPVADDASRTDDPDTRNHEYDNIGQLEPTLTENVVSRSGSGSENLDVPLASQPEVVRNDPLDTAHVLQYNFPSVSDYALSSATEPNAAAFSFPQGNTQMQTLSPFSSLMALKPGVFSNPQSTPQLPSTTMLTSPALPQHLPVHHYSQPALPLGHFANMISYPFLPQSYTYLPSIQQAFAANSPFHQSPAAVPSAGMKYSQPQFKSSLSATSLPQASAIASAYGGLGSSANIPGAFILNHTTASASTTIGFDEALSLQYKEGSHYMPLQQSENPAMWIRGAGSRTLSALPASTFYNHPGQNQHSGIRPSQQTSQLGALGYPNLYHSQAGPSREHQQNPGEGNLNGSQTPSQPANQIWQHGY